MCRRSWRRTALLGLRLCQARPGCGAGTTRRSPWAGRRRLCDAFALQEVHGLPDVSLANCTSRPDCQVLVHYRLPVLACLCPRGMLGKP